MALTCITDGGRRWEERSLRDHSLMHDNRNCSDFSTHPPLLVSLLKSHIFSAFLAAAPQRIASSIICPFFFFLLSSPSFQNKAKPVK